MKMHHATSRKGDFIFGVLFLCVIGGLIYKGLSALSQQNALLVFRHKKTLHKPAVLTQAKSSADHDDATA